jgi:hypothetical protein
MAQAGPRQPQGGPKMANLALSKNIKKLQEKYIFWYIS